MRRQRVVSILAAILFAMALFAAASLFSRHFFGTPVAQSLATAIPIALVVATVQYLGIRRARREAANVEPPR